MGRRIKVTLPEGLTYKNIDLEKYKNKPLLLQDHDWNRLPLGEARDIKLSRRGLYITAKFHKLTGDSKYIDNLRKQGLIVKANPGGYASKDKDGNVKFEVFEISICP